MAVCVRARRTWSTLSLIVLQVMQDAGAGARGDDGRVGEPGALADELVRQFRLEFAFVHTRLELPDGAPEPLAGDFAGAPDQFDFILGLFEAQLVHQRRQAPVVVQRIGGLGFADEPGIPRLHLDHRPAMLVAVQAHLVRLAHELAEQDGKRGQPFHPVNAREGARLGFRQLVPFPGPKMFARLAQEQDLALLRIEGLGGQDQDGFLLLDAGEVKQVGVGREHLGAVGIGRQPVVGVHHRQGLLAQPRAQPVAIVPEQPGGNRVVPHGIACALVARPA